MKKLLTSSCLLLAIAASAQLHTEVGIAPVTSRARVAATASLVYRMGDAEVSLPAAYETGHNLSAGTTVGYRFPGSYRQGHYNDGIILHAGYGYSWHSQRAKNSGEQLTNWMPVIGLKYSMESRFSGAAMLEARYQGGSIMFLFGYRF